MYLQALNEKYLKYKKVKSRAPLRLSFGGGGSELSPYLEEFGGNVMNATISMYAYTIIEPMESNNIRFEASDLNIVFESEAVEELDKDGSLIIHKAVYNRMIKDFNNGMPLPINISTFCDAPVGSGLGSSSTLTVSIIGGFCEILNLNLNEYEIAKLAHSIERNDLGLSGGHQDHYSASFGGFNFIEFMPDLTVIVNPLRLKDTIISELESSLLLIYTGTSRESAKIIEEQTKNMATMESQQIQHFHDIKAQAVKMKEYLLTADFNNFATTLNKAWEAKKATTDLITNSNINHIYRIAKDAGALGGKISGAGGGGFMMLVCDPSLKMNVLRILEENNCTNYVCKFVNHGLQTWQS